MISRALTGFALTFIGISLIIYMTSEYSPKASSTPDQSLIQLKTNINNISNEVSSLASTIHENDSRVAVAKINQATSITANTKATLNNVKGRVQQIPRCQLSNPFCGGRNWDERGLNNAINAYESNLNNIDRHLSEASKKSTLVSNQMVNIDSRVKLIDKKLKKEASDLNKNIIIVNQPAVASTNWLSMLVSVIAILSGSSTILLGWRKDRRELIELREKVKSDDSKNP